MTVSSLASVLKKNDGQTGNAQASGAQAQRAGQQAGASPPYPDPHAKLAPKLAPPRLVTVSSLTLALTPTLTR